MDNSYGPRGEKGALTGLARIVFFSSLAMGSEIGQAIFILDPIQETDYLSWYIPCTGTD